MDREQASRRTRDRREREAIVEYLELAACAEQQRSYEQRVPIANVPAEVISIWEDIMISGCGVEQILAQNSSLSDAERDAIRAYHRVWDQVAEEVAVPHWRSINDLLGSSPWERLMKAAQLALNSFAQRGRLSGDITRQSVD